MNVLRPADSQGQNPALERRVMRVRLTPVRLRIDALKRPSATFSTQSRHFLLDGACDESSQFAQPVHLFAQTSTFAVLPRKVASHRGWLPSSLSSYVESVTLGVQCRNCRTLDHFPKTTSESSTSLRSSPDRTKPYSKSPTASVINTVPPLGKWSSL